VVCVEYYRVLGLLCVSTCMFCICLKIGGGGGLITSNFSYIRVLGTDGFLLKFFLVDRVFNTRWLFSCPAY
jgi:hypothetical protein